METLTDASLIIWMYVYTSFIQALSLQSYIVLHCDSHKYLLQSNRFCPPFMHLRIRGHVHHRGSILRIHTTQSHLRVVDTKCKGHELLKITYHRCITLGVTERIVQLTSHTWNNHRIDLWPKMNTHALTRIDTRKSTSTCNYWQSYNHTLPPHTHYVHLHMYT